MSVGAGGSSGSGSGGGTNSPAYEEVALSNNNSKLVAKGLPLRSLIPALFSLSLDDVEKFGTDLSKLDDLLSHCARLVSPAQTLLWS